MNNCVPLKNINYQNLLVNKTINIEGDKEHDEIGDILEKQNYDYNKPWNRLEKFKKLEKLREYSKYYIENNQLENEKEELLFKYLQDNLNRKKLLKQKEVIYDIESQKIKEIPNLQFLKAKNRFTIKNIKKSSTIKNIKNTKLKRK